MQSYISRCCSSCCRHCPCFKAPYYIVPTPCGGTCVVVSKGSRFRFEVWPCHHVVSQDRTFQSRLSLSTLLYRWEVAKHCCRVTLGVRGGVPEIIPVASLQGKWENPNLQPEFCNIALLCLALSLLFISHLLIYFWETILLRLSRSSSFFSLEDRNFVESIISNNNLPLAKEILEAVFWKASLNLSF